MTEKTNRYNDKIKNKATNLDSFLKINTIVNTKNTIEKIYIQIKSKLVIIKIEYKNIETFIIDHIVKV